VTCRGVSAIGRDVASQGCDATYSDGTARRRRINVATTLRVLPARPSRATVPSSACASCQLWWLRLGLAIERIKRHGRCNRTCQDLPAPSGGSSIEVAEFPATVADREFLDEELTGSTARFSQLRRLYGRATSPIAVRASSGRRAWTRSRSCRRRCIARDPPRRHWLSWQSPARRDRGLQRRGHGCDG
jgi:hypothetical protein